MNKIFKESTIYVIVYLLLLTLSTLHYKFLGFELAIINLVCIVSTFIILRSFK